jgi:transcription antitermination protein NusB
MAKPQPRRVARELALLSLSQIKGSSAEKLEENDLEDLIFAATKALTEEIQYILENASADVKRGSDRLLASDILSSDLQSSKTMVEEALELTKTAINRLGAAVELPLFVSIAGQYEVRQYALELIATIRRRKQEIEEVLEKVLVDWQLKRLSKIDQDILRLAVGEILFLDIPQKVAINEAIELAKRYSDDDAHRFINGVLRRVSDHQAIAK